MTHAHDPASIEEVLRASEERFKATFEQAAVGLAHVALDGRWLLINAKLAAILGYGRDELLQLTFQAITYPDDLEADLQQVRKLLAGDITTYTLEKRYIRKDHSLVWINLTVSLVRDADDQPKYFIAVVEDINERKRLEALRTREAQFELLFAHSPDAILLIDPHHPSGQWMIVECNEVACEMHGYTREELVGHPLDRLNVLPGYPEGTRAYLETLRSAGKMQGEALHRHKNGEIFPIEYSTSIVMVGGRELVLGIDRDVSERKRLEELSTQGEQLRLLFTHSPDAIVLIDPHHVSGQWTIIECNTAACRLHGYIREELLGKPLTMLWSTPDDTTHIKASLERMRAGETLHVERQHHHQDGYDFPVEDATALVTLGDREMVLSIERDITERKQAEANMLFLDQAGAAVSASLDYEATLVRVARLVTPHMADCCIVDMLDDGALRPVAVAHTDPAKEELVWTVRCDSDFDANVHFGMARVLCDAQALLIPDIAEALEHPSTLDAMQRALLEVLQASSYMIVPLVARGRILGSLSFVCGQAHDHYTALDLALAKELASRAAIAVDNARLYAEAQSAAVMRAEFLSIAAHELRTPVTSLSGYVQLLYSRAMKEPNTTKFERKAVEVIWFQTQRLTQLINTLLDLTRIETQHFTLSIDRIDLAALVRRIVEETNQFQKRHTIELDDAVGDQLLMIKGDGMRLQQVFHNLLQNAIKYSPQGGVIRVLLRHDNNTAEIAVQDYGIGIPQEALPHVFERFYRVNHPEIEHIKGIGIGLFLVREIVTRHNGTVSVQSQLGRGSTFTVHLPLLDDAH